MQHIICSVRDAKSDAFGRPFFTASVGLAIRSFDDEVNRPAEDNIMFHHSEDFALFELGTFDDFDGSFVTHGTPKLLIQADQVKKGQLHKAGITAV